MECVETPGSVLRRARQDQAMSVKELSAITRIAPRLIVALEDDRFEEIPAEVFVRGFLKSCARELKLDGQHLIDAYELHTGKQPPRKRPAVEVVPTEPGALATTVTTGRMPRFSYVIAVLAVVFGLGLSILIFSESDREQLSNHSPVPSTQQWHSVGP